MAMTRVVRSTLKGQVYEMLLGEIASGTLLQGARLDPVNHPQTDLFVVHGNRYFPFPFLQGKPFDSKTVIGTMEDRSVFPRGGTSQGGSQAVVAEPLIRRMAVF